MPTRIDKRQRVIEYVSVSIEALSCCRLDDRIRCDESPEQRIVQPRVHVDEPDLVVVLVPRVPPIDGASSAARVLSVRLSSFAEGIGREAVGNNTVVLRGAACSRRVS